LFPQKTGKGLDGQRAPFERHAATGSGWRLTDDEVFSFLPQGEALFALCYCKKSESRLSSYRPAKRKSEKFDSLLENHEVKDG